MKRRQTKPDIGTAHGPLRISPGQEQFPRPAIRTQQQHPPKRQRKRVSQRPQRCEQQRQRSADKADISVPLGVIGVMDACTSRK